MRVFKVATYILVILFFGLLGCKKKVTQEVVYDNVIYELNPKSVYITNAEKTKQKNESQYQSITYSDLYQKSIPKGQLNDLTTLSLAFGDKQVFNELIISNYMNDVQVIIPSDGLMRSDVKQFVKNTYLRFYLREPSELELYYFENLINEDNSLTPEMIYYSFTISNEYQFY